MVVMVYKVRNFGNYEVEVKYITKRQFAQDREAGAYRPMEIELPERFHPAVELGTTRKDDVITVECGGVRYPLEDVLGADGWGEPALVWKDAQYGFLYRVRLEVV